MFKILGAKNRRKNLHKHPGPPFQIRGGPGSFSNAVFWGMKLLLSKFTDLCTEQNSAHNLEELGGYLFPEFDCNLDVFFMNQIVKTGNLKTIQI